LFKIVSRFVNPNLSQQACCSGMDAVRFDLRAASNLFFVAHLVFSEISATIVAIACGWSVAVLSQDHAIGQTPATSDLLDKKNDRPRGHCWRAEQSLLHVQDRKEDCYVDFEARCARRFSLHCT
jgi:hypothetical protein